MKPTTPGARIEAVLRGYQPDGRGSSRKLVLLGIAMHDGEGGSWPSTATLAEYASVDERNVRKALRALEDEGVISTHSNEGGTRNTRADRRSNLYVVDYDRLTHDLTSTSPRSDDGGTPASERGDASVRNGGTPASPEQDLELDSERDNNARASSLFDVAESQESVRVVGSIAGARSFERFWAIYPRRAGKGDARKAWAKAIRKADPEAILAGAERFRDDPNLPPMTYVPHPATWLNQERWNDDPLPARTGSERGAVGGRAPIDTNRDAPEGRIDL